MSLNINKCHILHAHRTKQPIIYTYTMDNTPVTPVTHHPYLGNELQSDITHTEHNQQSTEDTKHAEKKHQTSLYNCKITGIQDNSQTSTWICISHLGSTHGKDTTLANNKTARCVHHDYSHYKRLSFLQKQLNWPPLSVQRLQSRLVLFYKICQQKIVIPIPPYLQIPLRTTRHTSNIIENSYRYRQLSTSTDTYKYSYFPWTITYLNSLPPSMCATPTAQDLKEGLARYLFPSL